VLISSWRVSRLNVVRAVRDLPEPDRRGRSVWGVLVAVTLPLAGSVAFWQGLATQTMAFYLGGISYQIRLNSAASRSAVALVLPISMAL
jgi:putative ABC transport system permease protein